MGKILEKLMKKYWKNAKNTGKVYEKNTGKMQKKTGKVREIRQSKKVGTMNTKARLKLTEFWCGRKSWVACMVKQARFVYI